MGSNKDTTIHNFAFKSIFRPPYASDRESSKLLTQLAKGFHRKQFQISSILASDHHHHPSLLPAASSSPLPPPPGACTLMPRLCPSAGPHCCWRRGRSEEGGGRQGGCGGRWEKREKEGGGSAGLPYMAVDELYANIGLRGSASRFCRQSVVASRV